MSSRGYNWPVPYLRAIEGDFEPGQTVVIKGFVLSKGRFDINLGKADDVKDSGDVVFHMSNRVEEKDIVMNTRTNGEWGKELRKSGPFKENEEFDIRIRAHPEKFEVFANGKDVGEYEYRMPLNACKVIYISGDIELHHVSWEGRYYPMPFSMPLNGIGKNQAIFVSGVVDDKCDRFTVNLQAGGDIALHFNPRFGEKTVVRNHQSGGAWGDTEERDGEFNLKKGQTFDIIFTNAGPAYNIYLNGAPYCSFNHRIDADRITGLEITGDIQLQNVHFK